MARNQNHTNVRNALNLILTKVTVPIILLPIYGKDEHAEVKDDNGKGDMKRMVNALNVNKSFNKQTI